MTKPIYVPSLLTQTNPFIERERGREGGRVGGRGRGRGGRGGWREGAGEGGGGERRRRDKETVGR